MEEDAAVLPAVSRNSTVITIVRSNLAHPGLSILRVPARELGRGSRVFVADIAALEIRRRERNASNVNP